MPRYAPSHGCRRGVGVSIQRLQSHWGFTRIPFGRDLAPAMLHRHAGHGEAVARISWCVDQRAIGITGEVGAGKTVAVRAATAALDPSRHVIIDLANPTIGVRGMLTHIVAALGHTPPSQIHPGPQAAEALAGEHAERQPQPGDHRRRGLLRQLTKNVLGTALDAEMTEHLGYDKHDPVGRVSGSNSRNGTRPKTVFTEIGPVEIEVPATAPCASASKSQNATTGELSVENRRLRRQLAYALGRLRANTGRLPAVTRILLE